MPIDATCDACGTAYRLKDEFAGRRVKCPRCAAVLDVPAARPAPAFEVVDEEDDRPARPRPARRRDDDEDDRPARRPAPAPAPARDDGDLADDGFPADLAEAFRRDKFLLRQKLWSIKEKYTVADEDNEPVLWVERPAHVAQSLLAVLAGLAVMAAVGGGGAVAAQAANADALLLLVIPLAVVLGIAVIVQLSPRRHVTFYADKRHRDPLMRAFQDHKWVFVNQWYTLADDTGAVLCRFRKNFLHGVVRRRWYVHAEDGEVLYVVKEDSLILSVLRRTIGVVMEEIPLLGLALAAALRTNFVFARASDGRVLGEFNRRLTLLDRYVLDLTDDEDRELDRRVAVAMGVLLDTGERR